MKKLRVVTVVGTRPELIRLSRVIAALDRHTDHLLVHTGQNFDYELRKIFFDEMKIRQPDHLLETAGSSLAETIGNIIREVDRVLEEAAPDALLVLGDTNSCLSVIPAKRRKIPIFHMEAGNRCFDQRVPEETNRRIVDHVADINLPYSDLAREHLLREGIPPDRIIKTGSPMKEVLAYYRDQIVESDILHMLHLKPNKFFVVSSHREENVDSEVNFAGLVDIVNSIAEQFELPVIMSTHPRTRKIIEGTHTEFHPLVQTLKPLGYFPYVALQMNACAVLSDSGTITEESSILGFPALNIREAHERPEGMEEAAVMMTGLDCERVFQALHILQDSRGKGAWTTRVPRDYDVPVVSEKVVRIILSYTDYVRRTVWQMQR
jgi:UDP-N-acetylglucosamine 2-epimerase (non-hydrolysing)